MKCHQTVITRHTQTVFKACGDLVGVCIKLCLRQGLFIIAKKKKKKQHYTSRYVFTKKWTGNGDGIITNCKVNCFLKAFKCLFLPSLSNVYLLFVKFHTSE